MKNGQIYNIIPYDWEYNGKKGTTLTIHFIGVNESNQKIVEKIKTDNEELLARTGKNYQELIDKKVQLDYFFDRNNKTKLSFLEIK